MKKMIAKTKSVFFRIRAGFTLVEILVVVSITVLLSGIALTYNRSSERQVLVYKDQAVIVGVLQKAKSFAIQRYRDLSLVDHIACAFGLHFTGLNSREFILFQDLGEGSCDPLNANYAYDATADPAEGIETFKLDERLRFTGVPEEGLDILFLPPELKVLSSVPLPVTIGIETVRDDFSGFITISAVGQIITE